jgi:hypothetical protein
MSPMKKMVLAGSMIILAVVAVGCAAGPAEEKPKVSGSSVTSTEKTDGFSVSLTAEPRIVEPGGGVSLTLAVRNLSAEPRTFEMTSGQTYDFAAFEKDGKEVWKWSSGMMFTQALRSETIKAGESKVFKVSWPTAGLKSASHTVEGYFLGLKDTRPGVEVVVK